MAEMLVVEGEKAMFEGKGEGGGTSESKQHSPGHVLFSVNKTILENSRWRDRSRCGRWPGVSGQRAPGGEVTG